MAHNYPKWPKNDARIYALFPRALWANLSLSRARSELRDWLTRPLLGSPRHGSVATLYATLHWRYDIGVLIKPFYLCCQPGLDKKKWSMMYVKNQNENDPGVPGWVFIGYNEFMKRMAGYKNSTEAPVEGKNKQIKPKFEFQLCSSSNGIKYHGLLFYHLKSA